LQPLVCFYFDARTQLHRVCRWCDWLVRQPGRDWQGGTRTYAGHSGTDFVLPSGTPVVAMAAGRVTRVHRDLRGGPTVFVDHGGGAAASYRHLKRSCVLLGDEILRGGIIGFSGWAGTTWWSLGLIPPHLHITLWLDGLPADPYRDIRGSHGAGHWVEDNAPRAPGAADRQWDYQGSWPTMSTSEVLERASLTAPVRWANFQHHATRLLPDQLSVTDQEYCQPRLTLPFSPQLDLASRTVP
jgi:murein DD-endopeptidase MepM/ murein hydrolase activator NlpD